MPASSEDLRNLRYFWEETRDLTRLVGAEKILAQEPLINNLWLNYKHIELTLRLALDMRVKQAESEE